MSDAYFAYSKYEDGNSLRKDELKLAVDYVCGYQNNSGLNYRYYYDMYCYLSKSFIVQRWKKKNGYKPFAKIGEAICKDFLVNFLREKEHKNCACSSVYYNAVF